MIPLPEPDHTTPIKFGCDGLWFSVAKLRAYGDDVRAEERERAAQICTAAMPNPVTNWCDAQIVEALRQCAEAIRNYRAQDKAV